MVKTKIYPVYSLTQIRSTPRIQIAGQSVVSACRLVAYGACQERGQERGQGLNRGLRLAGVRPGPGPASDGATRFVSGYRPGARPVTRAHQERLRAARSAASQPGPPDS
ncbi:hypothetical protein SEA_ZARIA_134 [Mycobacterium phage Zaria]|nr:hypothetical protein SEA_ZARIA_134 [Mycobacterium phage Zaria]